MLSGYRQTLIILSPDTMTILMCLVTAFLNWWNLNFEFEFQIKNRNLNLELKYRIVISNLNCKFKCWF